MPKMTLAEFVKHVEGDGRGAALSKIAELVEIAEIWQKSQNSPRRKVRKSYTREFKLQTLALLQTGRMQKAGQWVKISKRGKLHCRLGSVIKLVS